MADVRKFRTGQEVRLTGEGKYEYYTVFEGGAFGGCDTVRLQPATDYLRSSRKDRMDKDGCISALACGVEPILHPMSDRMN